MSCLLIAQLSGKWNANVELICILLSDFCRLTAILAKCAIRDTDSNVATALRTIVVLLFSRLMAGITGSYVDLYHIDGKTLLFLTLSGMTTGGTGQCSGSH